MAKAQEHIHDLNTLEKEIYRLQLHARDQQDALDRNVDYFKDNYGKLIKNSILHPSGSDKSMSATIMDKITHHPAVQSAIQKVVDHIAKKATDGVDAVLGKIL